MRVNFLLIWDALHNSIIPTAIILMIIYCYWEGEKEVRSVYRSGEHVLLLFSLSIFAEVMERKNKA